jgi:hypothetical protein
MTELDRLHSKGMPADSEWFPRPQSQSDIMMFHPNNGFSPPRILKLLSSASAEEWQDKVDLAQSPTRLLASQGWVLKTSTERKSKDADVVQAQVSRFIDLADLLQVWHPEKTWFVLRAAGYYWPCSLTPQIETLPDILDAAQQERQIVKRLWLYRQYWKLRRRSLFLVARSLLRHGLYISMERENFAHTQKGRRIYYLDDEVYCLDLDKFFRKCRGLGFRFYDVDLLALWRDATG